MMRQWNTICPIGNSTWKLDPEDGVLFLGSCFAGSVAERMGRDKFNVLSNPFGVIYNPASISSSLDIMLSDAPFDDTNIFKCGSSWASWAHHGSFSDVDRNILMGKVHDSLEASRQALRAAKCLVVTLGSSRYFRLKSDGRIVSNCHKMPQVMFEHVEMDVAEMVSRLSSSLENLFDANSGIHVILTVSPIRYLSYGFHESQLGKARLLLAAEELCRRFEMVEYFPSYEIMLDELRDYRYYKEDMVHPSDVAVDYIYERFLQTYLSGQSHEYRSEVDKIMRMIEHRPFDAGAEAYRLMIGKVLKKIDELCQRYGKTDWTKEIEVCNLRLER